MTGEHLDDDILSAALDSEASPGDRAHLEGCATCRVRLAELQRAATAIATPVAPVDPARRDAVIAAALGVAPLASRRRRREIPSWAWAAAAVVLALVVILPLVARSPGRDDADMAGGDTETALRSTDDSAGSEAMSAPAPIDAGDLGPLDDAAMRERINAYLTGTAPSASAATGSGLACLDALRQQDTTLGTLRLFGRATIDGRAAELLVFDVPNAERLTLRVYAVAQGDCATILRFASFDAP